jgi:GNAT superfamily N-acetyltransferase
MTRVELQIPANLHVQFVYRMVRTTPYRAEFPAKFTFLFMANALDGLRNFSLLRQAFGTAGAIKAVLKLVTWRRTAYVVSRDGEVVSSGWCTRHQFIYYRTELSSVTIGPIETAESVRGRGLASLALQAAIDQHIARGTSIFYIDTSQGNFAAQRVFEKCGWGAPVAAYLRDLGP